MERIGEDDLIARCFAPLAGEGAFGLEDDAASLTPPPACDLVLTKDALVAGVHFFPNDPPDAIAKKALRVNLSDLAAKGAVPAGFLLGLALPPDWTLDWLDAFARGLGEDAAAYACPLLGGDTVKTPGPLTLSVTAFGFVPQGRMVRRFTAAPGDALFVTGSIGDAALGLKLRRDPALGAGLPSSERLFLLDRYLLPRPRNSVADLALDHARAAMDVSDGLAGDLAKMLKASGVTGDVEAARVPLSAAASHLLRERPDLFDAALTGGDDYELLLAVPPERAAAFAGAVRQRGVPVARIGIVTEGQGLPSFLMPDGRRRFYETGSFQHF